MENKRFEITETAGSVKGFYVGSGQKNRGQLPCGKVWNWRGYLSLD